MLMFNGVGWWMLVSDGVWFWATSSTIHHSEFFLRLMNAECLSVWDHYLLARLVKNVMGLCHVYIVCVCVCVLVSCLLPPQHHMMILHDWMLLSVSYFTKPPPGQINPLSKDSEGEKKQITETSTTILMWLLSQSERSQTVMWSKSMADIRELLSLWASCSQLPRERFRHQFIHLQYILPFCLGSTPNINHSS